MESRTYDPILVVDLTARGLDPYKTCEYLTDQEMKFKSVDDLIKLAAERKAEMDKVENFDGVGCA